MVVDRNTLTQWLWPVAIVLFFMLVMTSSRAPAAESPHDDVQMIESC